MRLLLAALVALLLSGCFPQVRLAHCNGVLVAPDELVTAAHCLPAYGGGVTFLRLPLAQGQATGRAINATAIEVDAERDMATLRLSESLWSPYYATYREPHVGATGYVLGGCPHRVFGVFRAVATGRVTASDGVTRWEWHVRDGAVSCKGDSGAPIWSDTEAGVFYGVVSRYERVQVRVGDAVLLIDAGVGIFSGAGK